MREDILPPSLQSAIEEIKETLPKNGGILSKNFTQDDVVLLYELGYQLYQVGNYKKGEEVFRRLVVAAPLEKKHWQGLGSCQQMQNKYQDAILSWSMVVLLDPSSPLPHFHAAECLFSLNQIDQGLEALKATEERDKTRNFVGKIIALKRAWKR